ncbi:MAG: sugar ABC transporter ATP-binding protein [Ruminococcaceae bacterium]|nr:sugar ABC transporter ATP-binding protein [Oscillospiraceae bacterium]
MGETILRMEGIEKRFPGVHALQNCHFDLKGGEVHALLGENGAGKSTLMKVLTGVHKKDGGRIVFMGEELGALSTQKTQAMGISMIHQELNLMPHLSAAQNIFIGREPRIGGVFTDEKRLNREAMRLFQMLGLGLDPRVRVADITVAKQQMVEIAKALSFESKVLIMDEPTAALTAREIEELFKIIRDLKARGVGIVYISHRMEELMEITDRITVMRDGAHIKTVETASVTTGELIHMMVGRTIFEQAKESGSAKREVALEVRGLNTRVLKDISFTLHRGEILGFAGLMGAGRTEVARAIFGADTITSGEILIKDRLVRIASPKDAVRCGIGYLSEDRKRYGLALSMTVEENTVLASMKSFSRVGFIRFRETAKTAADYVSMLKTKTPGIRQAVRNLSGGNQQKVIIAKWLVRDCDILIFDEPTRGIDIGAKSEIYKLLSELAAGGKSIIMISSELPEILRMSDRVAVMCEGRITKILDIKEANQETIMEYATQREEKQQSAKEN